MTVAQRWRRVIVRVRKSAPILIRRRLTATETEHGVFIHEEIIMEAAP